MTTPLRSAVNILLGRRHWPVPVPVRPRSLEEQAFEALVRPGDVVFDIGANTGATAVFFGRLAGVVGRVFAFEPVPSTYEQLCAAVQRDTYEKAPICTLPFGLADVSGEREMSIPSDHSALASLAVSAGAATADIGVRTERAPFVTLDEIVLHRRLPAPNLIKIDVEGAELLVLKGAARVLRESQPVLHVEVFAPWLRALNATPWAVLSYLAALGYEFIFTCPRGLVAYRPTREVPLPPEFVDGYNVICVTERTHADVRSRLELLKVGEPGLLPLGPAPMPNR